MLLDVAFALPIGPYRNPINFIPDTYCHVELSVHTTADAFRKQLVNHLEDTYSRTDIEALIDRLKKVSGKIIVCFHIHWGDKVACRYLSELIEEPFLRPPEAPVYDVVTLETTLEQQDALIDFYLIHLGKPYDYVRAVLSLFPITLRSPDPSRFYCAQLVLHSLKAMGMEFPETNIDHVSPLDVYRLLENKGINKENEDTNGPERTGESSS